MAEKNTEKKDMQSFDSSIARHTDSKKELLSKNVMDNYKIVIDDVPAEITIMKTEKEFVPVYHLSFPQLEPATVAVLDAIRERMLSDIIIKPTEILNIKESEDLKQRFFKKSLTLIEQEIPNLPKEKIKILAGLLLHKSLGMGYIEILLQDRNLEEIVINSAKEPVWVYHRELGWLKTNLTIPDETEIYNYASLIGRRVGTQITHLNPLMDAYLSTGDRANATLFPISSKGNTLTIRKFARRPWTIVDFLESNTLSMELSAFLWLAVQYELNAVIAGGTASGKTSLLNVLSTFIPPNHRIISIEDTRELQLPDFLHWVPVTTRPANPEGKGEITMLQLMINALRMRPDRVIVGEIRRSREAEVLFEAIHTGHSVYATLHANTAEEAYKRLTNPPINIPVALLGSLQLVVVMNRDRRKEIRRVIQVAELESGGIDTMKMELNTIYRWLASKDQIVKYNKSVRAVEDIKLYTGMSDKDIENDIREKIEVLSFMVKKKVKDINVAGKIFSEYYVNPDYTLKSIKKGTFKI